MVERALKLFLGLVGGMLLGIVIAGVGLAVFEGISFSEFFGKLASADMLTVGLAALAGIAAFVLAIVVLVPLHEAGHLVCGLLTGYRFVSFRIFNLTVIRTGGRLRVKRFAVAGTGGQCLLSPPDRPVDEIPVVWYNLGGLLANLLVLAVLLPLLALDLHPLLREGLVIFALTDAVILLTNGIPMQLGGIGNDAYNLILLRRSPLSRRALVVQLRSNEMIQEGIRPKDMPDVWFDVPDTVDYANALEVALPLMAASRLIDMQRNAEALDAFERLYSHRNEIMKLYVNEIACELAYLRLLAGHTAEAEALLDPQLRKYIDTYSRVMSSKQRILCAIALYIENDRAKAEDIYRSLDNHKNDYLLQGEVKSDLALMHAMLNPRKKEIGL